MKICLLEERALVIHQRDADYLSADEEGFREGFEILRLGVGGLEHAQRDEQLSSKEIRLGLEALRLAPVIDSLGRIIDADARTVIGHLVAEESVTDLVREGKALAMWVVIPVHPSDSPAITGRDEQGVHPIGEVNEVVFEAEVRENRLQVNWRCRDSAPLEQLPSAGPREAGPDRFFHLRNLCNAAA